MIAADSISQEPYWQWLCSCPLLTHNEIRLLAEYFGSPRKLYEASSSDLQVFQKRDAKWVASLSSYMDSCSLEKCSGLLRERQLKFCSRYSPEFPDRLRRLPDCPFGLFYRGSLPDPDQPAVAIIGARRCSNYGAKMAAYLGSQFARRHVQVISGMAGGIDGMSQKACVEEGGHSFAVLGCGADICYPAENTRLYRRLPEKGGILSEYGPATPPLPENFPIRNRLISGLSDAVVVVEARKRSGSLITVDLALDQGKDVFAVPGRFGDELSFGCNHLIEQGAGILISIDGLLDEIEARDRYIKPAGTIHTADAVIRRREKRLRSELQEESAGKEKTIFPGLSDKEKCIYSKLDYDSKSFDQLLQETGLSMMELMEGLIALEVRHYAEEVSRNRYIRAQTSVQ